MTDKVHTEIYTHKSGKRYSVVWYYDNDSGSPLEDDGYGVTERMDWNPTSEGQLEQHILDCEPDLEVETQLRMMRVLHKSDRNFGSGLYYDVLSSLHLARTEWGFPDPEKAMEIVEKDYAFLKGWYDDDWHWLTASVAPLDEDGEPVEDEREFCSRYESTILDDDASHTEVIEDLIHQVEHSIEQRLHKGQMRLDLRPA